MPITSALMQCRSGIERCAATRSNYYATNPIIVIAGIDVTRSVDIKSLSLALGKNDQGSSARFTIIPPNSDQFTLSVDQLVYVSLGSSGNRIFGGQVLRMTTRYQRGQVSPWVDVEADDFGRLLDRRVVCAEYRNMSATDIAIAIIRDFTSGFSTDSVEPDLPLVDFIPFTNETVRGSLMRLSNLIGGGCLLPDAYGVIHLWGPGGDRSPKAGTSPTTLVANLSTMKEFSYVPDGSQRRTRVIVDAKSTSCPVATPVGETTVVVDAAVAVDYLIVGSGAGGNGLLHGGGGGGWVVTGTDVLSSGTYAIVVPTGGAAGSNGSAASFNGHTAPGGTAGAGYNGGASNFGGGAGLTVGPGPVFAAGGGGGGSAAAGGNAYSIPVDRYYGGAGGNGVYSAISGSPAYYGGGGGGNGNNGSGGGGLGGGGRGGAGGNPPANGAPNTGGGGGGGEATTGGSGIVILSYPSGTLSATGGVPTTTQSGRTVHTFLAGGDMQFVVSTVTRVAPPPLVKDLPVEDVSQIDPNPGSGVMVRIGTKVLSYLGAGGPQVASGDNPPGSVVLTGVLAGSQTITVKNASTIFTEAPGWLKIGDIYVRYETVGGETFAGIPQLGFGAISIDVQADTQVSWMGKIVLSTTGITLPSPIVSGEEVVQRIVVDNVSAQLALSALEGGDGIHEHVISDGRLSVAGAMARASSELAQFSGVLPTVPWETEDLNAMPGRKQDIAMGAYAGLLTIDNVDVGFLPDDYSNASTLTKVKAMAHPYRRCSASPVKQSTVLDALTHTLHGGEE